MGLISTILTTLDLIMAILVLGLAISIIKHQDKFRSKHLLFQEKFRVLRDFKELYYSYKLYRIDQELSIEEKLDQLLNNNFLVNDFYFGEEKKIEQNKTKLHEKLKKLDNLESDFKLLFNEDNLLPIQSFIFWYRMFVSDFVLYRIKTQEEIECSEYNTQFASEVKNLEKSYQKINELSLLRKLNNRIKLKR